MNFMGMEGFYWFFGQVEDRNDPLRMGRVRVRVFGLHPNDHTLVQTEHLPWAVPITPVTSASVFGVGHSPTGILPGSIVFGFFADGKDAQSPFILGTLALGIGHLLNNSSPNSPVSSIVPPTTDNSTFQNSSWPGKANVIGNKLMSQFGLQDYQAAGILGNLAHESSGLRPDIIEGGHVGPAPSSSTSRVGYGWAQWTNSKPNQGNLTNFINFVSANYKDSSGAAYDITKIPAQDNHNLDFLIADLKSQPNVINAVKQTTNFADAATAFMQKYERPSLIAAQASLGKRQNNSQLALNAIRNTNISPTATGASTVPVTQNG